MRIAMPAHMLYAYARFVWRVVMAAQSRPGSASAGALGVVPVHPADFCVQGERRGPCLGAQVGRVRQASRLVQIPPV